MFVKQIDFERQGREARAQRAKKFAAAHATSASAERAAAPPPPPKSKFELLLDSGSRGALLRERSVLVMQIVANPTSVGFKRERVALINEALKSRFGATMGLNKK